jgi:hypothetical protein
MLTCIPIVVPLAMRPVYRPLGTDIKLRSRTMRLQSHPFDIGLVEIRIRLLNWHWAHLRNADLNSAPRHHALAFNDKPVRPMLFCMF